jgi:hypothetical protein
MKPRDNHWDRAGRAWRNYRVPQSRKPIAPIGESRDSFECVGIDPNKGFLPREFVWNDGCAVEFAACEGCGYHVCSCKPTTAIAPSGDLCILDAINVMLAGGVVQVVDGLRPHFRCEPGSTDRFQSNAAGDWLGVDSFTVRYRDRSFRVLSPGGPEPDRGLSGDLDWHQAKGAMLSGRMVLLVGTENARWRWGGTCFESMDSTGWKRSTLFNLAEMPPSSTNRYRVVEAS